jgi:hypothetical protein
MWKQIRIATLLLILFAVVTTTWLDRVRTTSWQRTVWVGVFPIDADRTEVTRSSLAGLRESDFDSVENFIAREARRYGIEVDEPIQIRLYPSPATPPPVMPDDAGFIARLEWSLKLRWYRYRVLAVLTQAEPKIALFLIYHDPARAAELPHSSGMQRGLTGVVHLYASREYQGENDVVLTHELLHTFGTSDKYDLSNNVPLFPDGYAEPQRQPRWPQSKAEIMAGRIPVSATDQVMAASLDEVVVGPASAREMGWSRAK